MKNSELQFGSLLFNVYCSIVEYSNDLTVHFYTSLILISFQTWCLILQHLRTIPNQIPIVSFLEYFGIFNIVTA